MSLNQCKNLLIKRLILLLRPKVPNLEKEPRFLILSTTGLGDTLWATPAIRALRDHFPTNYIGIVTSKMGEALLKYNRHLDSIFIFQTPTLPSLFNLYFKLKPLRFTHILCFHTSQRSILPLAALLGARELIGSYGINKGFDYLLSTSLDNLNHHEIQRRLDLVAQTGAHSFNSSMEIFLGSHEIQLIKEWLETFHLAPYLPLVGLHPGAKNGFKQWPPSHFIELGNQLAHNLGCQIFVTGSKEEQHLVEEIASAIPGAIPAFHFPPLQLAALIKQMQLFISNDTGPMHIALAEQVPTIGVFSPTNPSLCGPYFVPHSFALFKPPSCYPCLKKQCQEPFCLMQIGVEEVYKKAVSML